MAGKLRSLTDEERTILASQCQFPDEWWENVNVHADKIWSTPEEALAEKVEDLRGYWQSVSGNADYKTRLQHDIDDPWQPHFVAPGIKVKVPTDWRPPVEPRPAGSPRPE